MTSPASVRRSSPSGSHEGTETERKDEVLTMDDEETRKILDSVSCGTARRILTMVLEASRTPKGISKVLDTSTQNVRYHLNNLEEAGLVEVTGFRYSEKGREMSVYESLEAPVIVLRTDEDEGEMEDRR